MSSVWVYRVTVELHLCNRVLCVQTHGLGSNPSIVCVDQHVLYGSDQRVVIYSVADLLLERPYGFLMTSSHQPTPDNTIK